MKKFTTILLLGLYLFLNMGLVINSHYCGGKLASVSLYSEFNNPCNKCGSTQKTNNCCKDTQVKLFLDEDHFANEFHFAKDFSDFIAVIPNTIFEFAAEISYQYIQENVVSYTYDAGPPKTPIYIQVRSLLI